MEKDSLPEKFQKKRTVTQKVNNYLFAHKIKKNTLKDLPPNSSKTELESQTQEEESQSHKPSLEDEGYEQALEEPNEIPLKKNKDLKIKRNLPQVIPKPRSVNQKVKNRYKEQNEDDDVIVDDVEDSQHSSSENDTNALEKEEMVDIGIGKIEDSDFEENSKEIEA